jgi:DNA polymerase III delta subunit
MTEKTSPSSNIYLFYGEDDFSLKRKIDHWKGEFAKKYSASSVAIVESQNTIELDLIKKLRDEMAPSLFSTKKLLIIKDCLPRKATQTGFSDFLLEFIPQIPKDYFVIFAESVKPDGRLGFTKKFLNLVTVNEFQLPHGTVLNQWIKAMAKTLGSSISDSAVERLAVFLGRDLYEEKKAGGRVIERKEAFDLWEAYTELLKLSSNTSQIEVREVEALVKPKIPDSVFSLTDQMIAKNQKGTFQALENFLSASSAEEKGLLIQVVGLLSEQLRSLLVVSLLSAENLTNDQIAERLGWSSGRVFITAKHSRNIALPKLKSLLADLLLIDHKIKSSDSNLKLEIDLFLAQATV